MEIWGTQYIISLITSHHSSLLNLWLFLSLPYVSVSTVTQSWPTLCKPLDCSTPGLPVHHQLLEFLQTQSFKSVMPSNHLILSSPLFLPPSIFPNIRVFSNDSVIHITWPKYWSFRFSISPSNEYSGLISFRIDWFDLLALQGLSRVFSNITVQKHQFFITQPSLWSNSHIHTWWLENP